MSSVSAVMTIKYIPTATYHQFLSMIGHSYHHPYHTADLSNIGWLSAIPKKGSVPFFCLLTLAIIITVGLFLKVNKEYS
jgi:hypothetical protein